MHRVYRLCTAFSSDGYPYKDVHMTGWIYIPDEVADRWIYIRDEVADRWMYIRDEDADIYIYIYMYTCVMRLRIDGYIRT